MSLTYDYARDVSKDVRARWGVARPDRELALVDDQHRTVAGAAPAMSRGA